MISLDLVIVTYNRLEKLKKTLWHYENQTKRFRNLFIVDNCSNDGTDKYLKEWYEEHKDKDKFNAIIIRAEENLGGAGGFYLGQKKAMELNADWVFVADDDAYAAPSMVEEFFKFIETHDTKKIAAVCAEVLNVDGSVCVYHRSTHSIVDGEYRRISSREEDYKKECFYIDDLSYVGSFLNAKALKQVGLVNPKYFIYFDDSEHSVRLKKYGEIIVVPSIKITHDGGSESKDKDIVASWRDYYMKRNCTHMLLMHYPKSGLMEVYKQLKDDFHLLRTWQKQPDWYKVGRTAVYDALCGRLGKHIKYRPGWCIRK